MSGLLAHSPASILRQALINLGLGTLPTSQSTWPIYYSHEANSPDDVITLYDTAGRVQGRVHKTGEMQLKHGVQVKVRSAKHKTGYTKAIAISNALDLSIANTIANLSSSQYIVYATTRHTDVIPLGKQADDTKRSLFTINLVMSLKQLS